MRLDIIDQENARLEKEVAELRKMNAKQSEMLRDAMKKHDAYIADIARLQEEILYLKKEKKVADEGIRHLEDKEHKILKEMTRLEKNIDFFHKHYLPKNYRRKDFNVGFKLGKIFKWFSSENYDYAIKTQRKGA